MIAVGGADQPFPQNLNDIDPCSTLPHSHPTHVAFKDNPP